MWPFKKDKRTTLMKYLDSFMQTKKRLLQIDFYDSSEKDILLQVFRGSDVSLWEDGFKNFINGKKLDKNFVFLIQFNDFKSENALNLNRFKKSDWYLKFHRENLYDQEFYFYIQPFEK